MTPPRPRRTAARLRLASPALAVALAVGADLGPIVSLNPAAAAFADSVDDYDLQPSFNFDFMEFFTLGQPPITRPQANLYARILNLSDEQRQLALDMQQFIADDYRRDWTLFREKLADNQHKQMLGENFDWAEQQREWSRLSDEFRSEIDRLRSNFFEDLRLMLDDAQQDEWERFERARRRVTTLAPVATYPTERLDLVEMVDALQLEPDELDALASTIEEYEVELDAALAARNSQAEMLEERMEEFSDAQTTLFSNAGDRGPDFDWAAAQQRVEDLKKPAIRAALDTRDAAARVRDVNERYIRRFAEQLPDDHAETFQARVAETRLTQPNQNFGFFGAGSRAATAFALLEDFETVDAMMRMQSTMISVNVGRQAASATRTPPLTDDQRRRVDQLKAEYDDKRDRLLAQYADALKPDDEPLSIAYPGGVANLTRTDGQTSGGMFAGFAGFGGGPSQPSEEQQQYQRESAELEQWAIEQIRDILTLDQRTIFAQF